ncbi:DUF4236 domain-containing protein [Aeromonas salmonicida]
MGFRFRQTINILPGVRINLGMKGASLSVGPRGASVTMGSRGTYANFGLPGTGLSYRTRLDQAASSSSAQARARAESKEQLRNELLGEIERLEQEINKLLNVHVLTPNPRHGHTLNELQAHYVEQANQPYAVAAPVRPAKPVILPQPGQPSADAGAGFFKKLFESEDERQERISNALGRWEVAVQEWERDRVLTEQRYQSQRAAWAEQYAHWQTEAKRHEDAIASSTANLASRFASDSGYFESLLNAVLQHTDWPRETLVSFEVDPARSLIRMDVDLPEIEDMPQSGFGLNRGGSDIVEKPLSQKAARENYARHVHGCLLRLIGISLFALPFENILISGFTQRISKQTGSLVDDYILSCHATKQGVMGINFNNLEEVDPIAALERFSLNRDMTSTYIFKSILL